MFPPLAAAAAMGVQAARAVRRVGSCERDGRIRLGHGRPRALRPRPRGPRCPMSCTVAPFAVGPVASGSSGTLCTRLTDGRASPLQSARGHRAAPPRTAVLAAAARLSPGCGCQLKFADERRACADQCRSIRMPPCFTSEVICCSTRWSLAGASPDRYRALEASQPPQKT